MADVYHDGEKEVQEKLGETHIATQNGRVIKNSILTTAINFIEKQPMVVLSSMNKDKEVWISLIIGDFGFIKVLDPNLVSFDRKRIKSHSADLTCNHIPDHPQIGSLFIELGSRRRYRVNGSCVLKDSGIELTVREAYPNCPKYIQRRIVSFSEYVEQTNPVMSEGFQLTETEKEWITSSDTFFVGSCSAEGMLDASHRGGRPGFIEVLDNGTLKIPDYPGNSLYNSFGNIVQHPHAGLLFIDFTKRKTLQLTGRASLLFNQVSAADIKKTGGTGRFWLFQTTRWITIENHHPAEWNFLEYSPFNP